MSTNKAGQSRNSWRLMIPLALLGAAMCSCTVPAKAPTHEDRAELEGVGKGPWITLSDDPAMGAWIQRGGKAAYRWENGEIIGSTRPNQPNSFLCTREDFGDFELEFDFKVDNQLNSGVQFRSLSLPEYQDGRVHGYQYEIDPTDRAYTAGIYDEARRGTWVANPADKPLAQAAFRREARNHGRVVAIGDHLRTWINDVPAVDVHDATTASGFIALQVHSVGDRKDPLEVRWWNVRVRKLEAAK